MRVTASFIAVFVVLMGCGPENPNRVSLQKALNEATALADSISQFPADSILSVRERLSKAKEVVRWLGEEESVEFVRDDAPIIGKLSEASRYLKDAPSRLKGLNGASNKCIDQITGLLEVIDSGANIDANGDTITDDYISENATREIDAVRKLNEVYLETHRLFRLGLETDAQYWGAIDSLLTAKQGVWARSIAEE